MKRSLSVLLQSWPSLSPRTLQMKCLIAWLSLLINLEHFIKQSLTKIFRPLQRIRREEDIEVIPYTFFGGKSNAFASCSKCSLWDPSQKGLLADRPQRQSETIVRPWRPYAFPSLSTISKSPSTLTDPLLLMISFVAAIRFEFAAKVTILTVIHHCFNPSRITTKPQTYKSEAFFYLTSTTNSPKSNRLDSSTDRSFLWAMVWNILKFKMAGEPVFIIR